jgi:hypothetical protein
MKYTVKGSIQLTYHAEVDVEVDEVTSDMALDAAVQEAKEIIEADPENYLWTTAWVGDGPVIEEKP